MNRLSGLCFFVKNIFKYRGFGLFENNLLNPSVKAIKSIEKCYHTDEINSFDEWINDLSEAQKQRVSLIRNELTLFSLQNDRVPKPEWISKLDYMEMLGMTTSRRRAYYGFLFGKYYSISLRNSKKIIRTALNKELEEIKHEKGKSEKPSRPGHIVYGLGMNALTKRISLTQIHKWKNLNLVRAYFQSQPPLVFDCEFVHTMNQIEVESAVREIQLSLSALRENRLPYVMHLCNLKMRTYFWDRLMNRIPNLYKLPIIVTSKDVTELFPLGTEKLIYLSPDAEHALDKVDPYYGYIIGAIVDKGDKKPFTLSKSKKLNIQSARLPIDGFVKFRTQKALTFDQVTKILLEAKRTNDWKKAFEHIPKRKIK